MITYLSQNRYPKLRCLEHNTMIIMSSLQTLHCVKPKPRTNPLTSHVCVILQDYQLEYEFRSEQLNSQKSSIGAINKCCCNCFSNSVNYRKYRTAHFYCSWLTCHVENAITGADMGQEGISQALARMGTFDQPSNVDDIKECWDFAATPEVKERSLILDNIVLQSYQKLLQLCINTNLVL